MPPVFQDFQAHCRSGSGVLFTLRCDYSRFPSRKAMDLFVESLQKAGKIDHLTQHIFTNDPFIIDDMSVQIWAKIYIAELPHWNGVTTLATDVSKTQLHQYATLLPIASDDVNAFKFDTYGRAVELAVLAASVEGDNSPMGRMIMVPVAMHEACKKFIATVKSSDEESTDTGNSSDDLFESSSESN